MGAEGAGECDSRSWDDVSVEGGSDSRIPGEGVEWELEDVIRALEILTC